MTNHAKAFETALTGLNAEQLKAVGQTEGPVMVVAGPGTGKTQILAARIGKILQTTQVLPENILCLTFTNTGTVAMRNRLLQFIGPDAHRVCIETFHSFCNGIIQENYERFGRADLDMLSDIEEIELLHQLIDELPKGHPLKRYGYNPYFDTKRLKSLFAAMKTENWTPELIQEKVQTHLTHLESDTGNSTFFYQTNYKDKKKGDKKKAFDEEVKRFEQTVAAAFLFRHMQEKMAKAGRYDYNDMIHWVLAELRNDEDFRLRYQERYQYILVDEYQDTNDAQNEVLSLLCSFFGDNPNLFVVGDDDQSIFRFQGANIENMLRFTADYKKHLHTVMLTQNYRSTQPILDAAGSLIRLNTERILNRAGIPGLSKDLLASNPLRQQHAVPPGLSVYRDPVYEAAAICQQITELVKAGVNPGEIAVIYRKHKQAEDMLKYFRQQGIGVNMRRRVDILQEPFTQNVLSLLQYASDEHTRPGSRDDLLFYLLHMDFTGIDNAVAIARFMAASKKARKDKSLKEVLLETAFSSDLFTPLQPWQEAVMRLQTNLNTWPRLPANHTLQEFFERLITSSGCLYHALHSPEKTFRLQQLNTLMDLIKSETAKRPGLKADAFLKTTELLREYGIGLPVQRMDYSSEGIQFTTAHGSKGEEYEYVFMPGCNRENWENDGGFAEFKLPPNIFRSNPADDEGLEEKRRLFYVGMTRAKKELHLSYCTHLTDGKVLTESQFVSELEQEAALLPVHIPAVYASIEEYEKTVLQPVEPPPTLPLQDPAVKEAVQHLKMSVTTLNSYLQCPVQFFYTRLLDVPHAKSAAQSFGIAVHHAYQQFFEKWKGKNVFGHPDELKLFFRWSMAKQEETFTPGDFRRKVEYGENILQKHFDKYAERWNKTYEVEYRLNAVILDGIPLTGFIDKLEFDGLNATVVDYKTGKFKKEKFAPPVEGAVAGEHTYHEVHGGDYWRQAVFYRILMQHDKSRQKSWQFSRAEFDFVEPDEKTGDFYRQAVPVTDGDVEIVTNQIKHVYGKIQSLNFDPGCGECVWCKLAASPPVP